MPYLYGDATPFPLDCDFIESLRALLQTTVTILLSDEQLEEIAASAERARDDAAREREKVDRVAEDVGRSLTPHHASMDRSQAMAQQIQTAAQGVIDRARTEIAQRRDAVLKDLEAQAHKTRAQVPRALEQYFTSRDLPETRWKLRYAAGLGERPQVQAIAHTPQKLELVMEVELPAAHALSRAVRIGDLCAGLVIELPVDKGWLKRGPRRELLDRWHATEVELDGDRGRIVLRKSDHKPSPGLEIDVRREGGRPTVRVLAEQGVAANPLVSLEGESAEAARRLLAALAAPLEELARKRNRATRSTIDGRPVASEKRPAAIALELIASVAHLVREMAQRSLPAAELVLKRDIGNGRREETYVPRAELLAILAPLSPKSRAHFARLGLEDVRAETSAVIELEPEETTGEASFVQITEPRIDRRAVSA